MENKFNFVMPAEIIKSEDGDWKIAGLASTEDIDQQGETIMQKGIDLSPVDKKRGYFNFDHLSGPENLIGTIDGYKQTGNGLYVHGKLFKNHDKAKSVYQIMSSLNKGEQGRVGLSVEGKILKRNAKNPKVIEKCQIDKVAVTFNPVNQKTYADLIKSMGTNSEIEFNSVEENFNESNNPESTFTASQVVDIVTKALGVGAGYTQAPNKLSDGDAMATSDMKPNKKKKKDDEKADGTSGKKKLKKMEKSLYKSNIKSMLNQLQELYPDYTREVIWSAIKDRMKTNFPDINTEYSEN